MRIAEVSKTYDISADTLRYYERIGLLPHVQRTKSGVRNYSEADCARIQFIKCLRGANVSIEARIDEMQAGLDRLNYKIDHYDSLMREAEQRIKA